MQEEWGAGKLVIRWIKTRDWGGGGRWREVERDEQTGDTEIDEPPGRLAA